MERVEQFWAKVNAAGGSISGRGEYGPRELFQEVIHEDDMDEPFSPWTP